MSKYTNQYIHDTYRRFHLCLLNEIFSGQSGRVALD